MSISDAINNAKHKINRSYSALENKGATIPDVKDLEHLPNAISSISEFSQEFGNWKYSGRQGYLFLNGTYVDSDRQYVSVPYTNYTYLTNTTFKSTTVSPSGTEPLDGTYNSSTFLKGVDCNSVPFMSLTGASQQNSMLN